jgi:hypothetical protein
MEQDKHVNKWGLTGDPEEDRRRKIAALNRTNRIRKNFTTGRQVDLLAGFGGSVAPVKSKSKRTPKFKRDQKTIMEALALGLQDYIPEDLAQQYGFTTRPKPNNPTVPPSDPDEPPF